jgi:hypothetical protein
MNLWWYIHVACMNSTATGIIISHNSSYIYILACKTKEPHTQHQVPCGRDHKFSLVLCYTNPSFELLYFLAHGVYIALIVTTSLATSLSYTLKDSLKIPLPYKG